MWCLKMALRFYNSFIMARTKNPTKAYYDDFVAMSEQIFDNAPNVIYNEIQYEAHYGQRDFIPIPMVRVDSVVNYNTGIQVGDDYKVFIFKPDFPVKPYMGMKFKWGRNYYLVINTNNNGSLSISAEVRRCNNTLRFFDDNGNKIYEPCIVDAILRFTNNNDTMTIVTGKAEQYVWCQRNKRTRSIKPNDRFLFGVPEQRIGFRLYVGGLGNSLNTITGDDDSPSLTQFYMEEYEIDFQQDDIINGFADAERFSYSIDISENSTYLDQGVSMPLKATLYRGKDVVDKNIVWSSDDEDIVSIKDGVINAVSAGETTIYAYMKDNPSIFGSMLITVLPTDTEETKYEIISVPDINYVLEGESLKVDVSLYKNGVKQETIFDIKDVSLDIPRQNYKIIPEENSFTLENYKMWVQNTVKVQCSCEHGQKVFEFTLRGLY